jgi:hypothetical protein
MFIERKKGSELMIINPSVLIRNRQKDRFFGIDYYVNLCHGSNPLFNYLSTPLDFYPLSNDKSPSIAKNRVKIFNEKISEFDEQKVFGIFDNPDIYECFESIKPILDAFENTKHGLFIMSDSIKILNDIELLQSFSMDHPLVIGVPVASYDGGGLSIIDDQHMIKPKEKLFKTLAKANINFGFVIKPIIPYINDDVEDFKALIGHLITYHPSFIYPTFSVNFDSRKLNAFYELIDHEKSALKTKFFDEFGFKKSWMSPNADHLKRTFIFNVKKHKIAYSMSQIINLYDIKDYDQQISLF